jgi:hypothetical protein
MAAGYRERGLFNSVGVEPIRLGIRFFLASCSSPIEGEANTELLCGSCRSFGVLAWPVCRLVIGIAFSGTNEEDGGAFLLLKCVEVRWEVFVGDFIELQQHHVAGRSSLAVYDAFGQGI